MALDPATLARRIQAARAVAGITQADLDAALEAKKLGSELTGRLERYLKKPERSLPPFTVALAEALVEHTGMPLVWFTEPDLARVFRPAEDEWAEQLERLGSWVIRLAAAADLPDAPTSVEGLLGQPEDEPKH